MLAPDNFQEEPKPVVAHRTSPTNLGLYLLSTIAARDFGWTGIFDTIAAPGRDVYFDEPARAFPRPLLQLVRHSRSYARWNQNMFLRLIAAIWLEI